MTDINRPIVRVLIDARSFFSACKSQGISPDYIVLRNYLMSRYRDNQVFIHYYRIMQRNESEDYGSLVETLSFNGYIINNTEMDSFDEQQVRADLVARICTDITKFSRPPNQAANIVLFTTSNDYVPALKQARLNGSYISVVTIEKGTDGKPQDRVGGRLLRQNADNLLNLKSFMEAAKADQYTEDPHKLTFKETS